MKIVVNGREVETEKAELSYADIVKLARLPERTDYTVVWSFRDESGRQGGELIASDPPIFTKVGMVISCVHTGGA